MVTWGKLAPQRSCPGERETHGEDTLLERCCPRWMLGSSLASTPQKSTMTATGRTQLEAHCLRSLENTMFRGPAVCSTRGNRRSVRKGSGSKRPNNHYNTMHTFPYVLFSINATLGKSFQTNRYTSNMFFLWLLSYLCNYYAINEYLWSSCSLLNENNTTFPAIIVSIV